MRVVVVDDERLARQRLKRLVAAAGIADVVGEAADGASAVACIEATKPDVVLLDVQMPEQDGFAVVRQLRPPQPLVIFVTAYDEFAVAAFEVHAVDYLLKPVSRERLLAALGRAQERIARPADLHAALAALLDHLGTTRTIERLPVRSQGHIDLVDVASVDWIEAANNHAILHIGRRTHILRDTLTRLEERLDGARFVRIHRSTIVQIDRIVRLDVAFRGDYDVTLTDGTRLSLSRTHRARLEHALGRPL
jgi:two-component system LytT family response regulator